MIFIIVDNVLLKLFNISQLFVRKSFILLVFHIIILEQEGHTLRETIFYVQNYIDRIRNWGMKINYNDFRGLCGIQRLQLGLFTSLFSAAFNTTNYHY